MPIEESILPYHYARPAQNEREREERRNKEKEHGTEIIHIGQERRYLGIITTSNYFRQQ